MKIEAKIEFETLDDFNFNHRSKMSSLNDLITQDEKERPSIHKILRILKNFDAWIDSEVDEKTVKDLFEGAIDEFTVIGLLAAKWRYACEKYEKEKKNKKTTETFNDQSWNKDTDRTPNDTEW